MAELARSPRELRDELEALVRDDLIGPQGGPEEELDDAPVDRYLLGLLAPRLTLFRGDGNGAPPREPRNADDGEDEDPREADALSEDPLAAASTDSGAEGRAEERPAAVDQLVPSAFGMTFALEPRCAELLV